MSLGASDMHQGIVPTTLRVDRLGPFYSDLFLTSPAKLSALWILFVLHRRSIYSAWHGTFGFWAMQGVHRPE